ncbi:hypothetical protein DV736_g5480, partial [Chaetothyriales sp. CBS 134916]
MGHFGLAADQFARLYVSCRAFWLRGVIWYPDYLSNYISPTPLDRSFGDELNRSCPTAHPKMASFLDNAFSLVHLDNTADQPSQQELKTQLEKGSDETKLETMRKILIIMLNGDPMPNLLMHIIRFVMPSKSKPLKKLLYFYYEICPKLDSNGKLKQEMILVCNGIRNDLQHPNEFVRGNTLRFLAKLREPELIEPLLSAAQACIEHRHAYVRKNAVWALASVYQHAQSLIPDAPEVLQNFLAGETDTTCKRNAFAALMTISHDKALEYLTGSLDGVPNADELLQLVELEFIRKDAVQNQANKARYLRLIFDLLEANTSTVVYEAATSLTSLTSNPVAVKAAASKLIDLSIKEADNNVKLIVLDRVDQLRRRNEGVLDDLTMEILRVLSSPDLDVRKKALSIALEMVSSKNVQEIVLLLKKELSKTVDEQYEKNNEYRQLLIQSIHLCAIKFSEIAASVVEVLMDFIVDFSNSSAVDVISFVKEVVEKYPKLRSSIVERLVSTLGEVRAGKVYRGSLWVIGEYSFNEEDIREAWKRIRASIGEIPILASEQRLLEEHTDDSELQVAEERVNGHHVPKAATGSRKVLADGTYATESALTSESAAKARLEAVKAASKPPLRQLILDGDYYLAAVLSATLTKLVMRHSEISSSQERTNALRAEAMLILISIIRVGQSQFVKTPIDEDSVDRIMSCVRSLAEFSERKELETSFLDDTRKAFRAMVQADEKKRADKAAVEKAKTAIQVDDVFSIRQLTKKGSGDSTDEIEIDLEKATGGEMALEDLSSKLSRVVQLTGFSDPVYAEAYVKVHQFDIILDVLLVNQTQETLQNLSVEFATLGDLKVVERPTTHNLGPQDFLNVQATIKVSSTDTGVIFGNVVYDSPSGTDTRVVILNDVHADIMDYIQPATCTESAFRTMDMATSNDPFADHAATRDNDDSLENENAFDTDTTLVVGRNTTLTLGTDALIVLDDGLRSVRFQCCGLCLPLPGPTTTRPITYYSILWAECSKLDLTIHYASPAKSSVHVAYIHYHLLDTNASTASKWTARLLDRAYGSAKRQKRIKLLINPFGGTGKAQKLYTQEIEPVFAAARCEVDVETTAAKGHAVEIAEKLDIDAYDVLASASGDGLPHECFNGLGRRPNAREALRKVAIAQLPCGSGNALSWNTNGTGDPATAALAIVKGVRTPIDLVSITQGQTRSLSFLSQSLGIVAESDLGTDHIRWMGDARFTYGFLVRLLGKTVYPIEYAVREEIVDKADIKRHYAQAKGVLPPPLTPPQADDDHSDGDDAGLPPLKYGTVNSPLPADWTPMTAYPNMGNFYVGNLTYMAANAPFFPAALPCDGFLDLVTIDGDISRAKSVDLLLSVPKGTFLDQDAVRVRKISALRVMPKYGGSGSIDNNNKKDKKTKTGFFSVDGEQYPFEPFQIEVHRALGTVLSKNPGVYEYQPIWDR